MKKDMAVKNVIIIVVIALWLGIMGLGIYKMVYAIRESEIVGAIVNLFILGYDSNHLRDMALDYMEKKYGENFVYSGDAGNGYFGEPDQYYVTCDSFPGKEIIVEVGGRGSINKTYRDNLLAIKYEEDIIKFLQEESMKFFENTRVFVKNTKALTSPELSAQASFEDLLADVEYEIECSIYLKASEVLLKEQVENMLIQILNKCENICVNVKIVDDSVYDTLDTNTSENEPEEYIDIVEGVKNSKIYGAYFGNDKVFYLEWEKESFIENNKKIENNDIELNDKISDKWEDGEFLCNGKKAKLMSNVSDLEKNIELKFSDYYRGRRLITNYETYGGRHQIGDMEKELTIYLRNNSKEIKNYIECDICGFAASISGWQYEKDPSIYPDIQLSKGITWNSTLDDIIKAYGEPEERYDRIDRTSTLSYETESGSKLQLVVEQDYGLTYIKYVIKNEM